MGTLIEHRLQRRAQRKMTTLRSTTRVPRHYENIQFVVGLRDLVYARALILQPLDVLHNRLGRHAHVQDRVGSFDQISVSLTENCNEMCLRATYAAISSPTDNKLNQYGDNGVAPAA